MKILILGSKGQLGMELARVAPLNADLTACDIDTLDIVDAGAVQNFMDHLRPEWVINAAAYTAVDRAEEESQAAFAVNHIGVENLAVAARNSGAKLLHVSTDYVFDGTNHRPYLPDDAPNPLNVYGRSKLAGEQALRTILPDSHIIFRTAWLYSIHGVNFLKTMINLFAQKDEISVVCDQIGTPSSATTLAEAIFRAIERDIQGTFHWTDSGVASWFDFAVAIYEESLSANVLQDTTCRILPIPASKYPTDAPRPFYTVLDKTDTYEILDMTPPHWRDALRTTLQELLANTKIP